VAQALHQQVGELDLHSVVRVFGEPHSARRPVPPHRSCHPTQRIARFWGAIHPAPLVVPHGVVPDCRCSSAGGHRGTGGRRPILNTSILPAVGILSAGRPWVRGR
jgi:hypothetical protein